MAILLDDALSQYVDLGLDIPSLNNVPGASISAWVKPTVGANTSVIMALAVGPPPGVSSTSRISLQVTVTGNPRVAGRGADAETTESLSSTAVLADGVWYHLVGVCDYAGDALLIYIDGVLSISSVVTFISPTSATNSKNGAVGAEDDASGSAFFDGIIDDPRVYSRALSASEVLWLYNTRGVDGNFYDLQQRYQLNERAVGVAANGSGSCRDSGPRQINATPTASPVYAAGNTLFSRRAA